MKKVIVGMSGGVDSSVSCLILKKQGFSPTGVFMKNWEENDEEKTCSVIEDMKDAEKICRILNIPFKKINFSFEYWNHVFKNFLEEYKMGKTPNPDILCNKWIKFKAFMDYSKVLGGEYIATGHYARKKQLSSGKYQLLKGKDKSKDQSYFLYTLNQAQLKYSLFPLGELNKNRVRQIAKESNFATHNKKDSTGICFIGKKKFTFFLKKYLKESPGEIHDENGMIIGQHKGLMYHTIGQRKGLNIGGIKNKPKRPWFSARKDLKSNILIAVQDQKHPLLMKKKLIINKLHWIEGSNPPNYFECTAKIRYQNPDEKCSVTYYKKTQYIVEFQKSQYAIASGQSVVFYNNDICLGGGVIVQ